MDESLTNKNLIAVGFTDIMGTKVPFYLEK